MCGINGIFGLENISEPHKVIEDMNSALAHRGPDSGRVFSNNLVALGHRRLSIIDTSENGNQPFFSKDRNLVLVFNGEIYNYIELKQELKEYKFVSNTDSEVVLASFLKWGKDCVKKFNGMFAFAIWNEINQELFISRDRLGIKPLYYTESNQNFAFSSELRSLLKSKITPAVLDKNSLVEYLRYQTVHAPRTIIENVYSIPAGHSLLLTDNERILEKYWSLENPSIVGNTSNRALIRERIRELLKSSIELRMRADVPFGAFLSGGIDSSAIVALMSQEAELPVSTFSVVFNELEFSEAKYARIIADKYKTNHHEILITARDFLEDIPNALQAMDHPSGDGPNTYMVSQVTKNAGVKMALSGLGGDEIFAGYDIFKRSIKLEKNKWIRSFAGVFRSLAGKALTLAQPTIAAHKIAEILSQEYFDLPHAYCINRKILFDKEIQKLLTNDNIKYNAILDRSKEIDHLTDNSKFGVLSKVSALEIDTYMSNVLLRDSDQMSMAHSLEVRVPFLDHRLVEYGLILSDEVKFPHSPKQLLVESLGELIPTEIVNRPKMGFTLPWDSWMKNELRSFCEDALRSLGERPEFNHLELNKLWHRFLRNDKIITWSRVWHLVTLSKWLAENEVR